MFTYSFGFGHISGSETSSYGSGTRKKFRIQTNPDSQHCWQDVNLSVKKTGYRYNTQLEPEIFFCIRDLFLPHGDFSPRERGKEACISYLSRRTAAASSAPQQKEYRINLIILNSYR
jgi:hypothetical protein